MQHPPEKIKEVAELLCKGEDIVVGCRKSIKKWTFHRKIISVSATKLADVGLFLNGAPGCSDVLSGFFGIRRELAEDTIRTNKHRFQPEGYKVLYDMLKCLPRRIRVSEVEYDFGRRGYGTSKIGLKHIVAFLFSLLK